MNKLFSTKERVFILLVGPSGSGKLHLIFDWLKIGTFPTKYEKKIINLFMDKCKEKILNLSKELNMN